MTSNTKAATKAVVPQRRGLVLFNFRPAEYGIAETRLFIHYNAPPLFDTSLAFSSSKMPVRFIPVLEDEFVDIMDGFCVNPDWRIVRNGSGQVGLVPASLLMFLPDAIPEADESVAKEAAEKFGTSDADDVEGIYDVPKSSKSVQPQSTQDQISRQIGISSVLLLFDELVAGERKFACEVQNLIVSWENNEQSGFFDCLPQLSMLLSVHLTFVKAARIDESPKDGSSLQNIEQYLRSFITTAETRTQALVAFAKTTCLLDENCVSRNQNLKLPFEHADFHCNTLRRIFDAVCSIINCKPALIDLVLDAYRQAQETRRHCTETQKVSRNLDEKVTYRKSKSVTVDSGSDTNNKVSSVRQKARDLRSRFSLTSVGFAQISPPQASANPRHTYTDAKFSPIEDDGQNFSGSIFYKGEPRPYAEKSHSTSKSLPPHSTTPRPNADGSRTKRRKSALLMPPDVKRHWRSIAAAFVCPTMPHYRFK